MEDLELRAKELRNAYARKWRQNNKDKVKKANMNYWKNKAKKEIKE